MRFVAVTILAVLALGGCGGGGGDSSTGQSTSSSVPSAPSTPAVPVPTGPTTLLTASVGTPLPGYASVRNFVRDDNGVTSVGFSYTASYGTPASIPGPGSFTYQLRSEFFGGTALPTGSFALSRKASSDASWTYLSGLADGRQLDVAQLVVGSTNPVIALQYTTLAVAKITYANTAPGMNSHSVSPMAFGLPFDRASAAQTGTIAYNGQIAGIASAGQLEGIATALGSKSIYDLSGSIRLELDYTSSTFKGEVHIIGKDDLSGRIADLGTYPIVGQIPSASTSSSISGSVGGGSIQLTLTGPSADELEATFESRAADPINPSYSLKVLAVAAAKR